MDLELRGRIAFVTGASDGLGYACAEALSAEGASVAIMARDQARVRVAQDNLMMRTKNAVVGIAGDLRSISDLDRVLASATEAIGPPDIVVVSTGHPPTKPFSEATDADWEEGLSLILKPAIALARKVIPGMRQRKYGRLIFIGSIFGLEPEVSSVVQSTLRTGLNAMVKCISREVAADAITANIVCPGYYDTPLVHRLAEADASRRSISSDAVLDEWRRFSPTGAFGRPSDLGKFVAFLASPFGQFIQGTSLVLDGGALHTY